MNKNHSVKMYSQRYLVTLLAFYMTVSSALLLNGYGQGEDALSSHDIWSRFLALRSHQMQEKSREKNLEIPPEYEALLQAVHAHDWLATSNAFERLSTGIAQYQGSKPDPRLNTGLWQYALEIYGAFEHFANWHPGLIQKYGHDIVAALPSNSVFFGGTDPGRFVVTAFQEVTQQPFNVVTQNALADNLYMDYLRDHIGNAIWLPTQEDINNAFQQYIGDIRDGRVTANADLKVENGRVVVQGVGGVMLINGIIARMIFDKNKANHDFFLEESYVIPWMYSYLQPAGLTMRLNPEPTEITAEMVAEDRQFWDSYTVRLMNNPDFERNRRAQVTYSKLRSAIGGLYAHHGRTNDAEYAFIQSLQLFPASPEATLRLAYLYAEGSRWDEAILAVEAFQKLDPKNEEAGKYREKLQTRRSYEADVLKRPVSEPE